MENKNMTKRLTIAGLLLALALIIPSIFHTTGIPGKVFLPMHIPVFLGGFLLTPKLAFLLGALAPILNSLLTGMPKLMPTGIVMVFELASYGLLVGILRKRTNFPSLIILIISMIGGRLVAGGTFFVLSTFFAIDISLLAYMIGGLTTGLPGIIIQIILIPSLVFAIEKYTNLNIYW